MEKFKYSNKLKTRRQLAVHLARFGSANVYRVDGGGRFQLDWSPAIGKTNESGVLFLQGNPSSIKDAEKHLESTIALHFFGVVVDTEEYYVSPAQLRKAGWV